MTARRVDAALAAHLVDSLEYVLLDIDGVIWSGSTVTPRVPETLQYLRSKGKQVRFLTNNASWSREQIVATFAARGMPEVQPREVYNSGYAAALRLQQLLGTSAAPGEPALVHGNVLVVGEQGLHDELQRVLAPGYITYGVELHSPEVCGGYDFHEVATAWRRPTLPPPRKRLVLCDGNTCRAVQADPADRSKDAENKISLADLSAVAVVAGLDLHYNITTMAYASLALQGPPADVALHRAAELPASVTSKAVFIACNEDPQIPAGTDKMLVPGAGGMISSLATVSGVAPAAVCGKPNTDLARILFEAEGVTDPRRQCMMVGDRLTTDIAFGNGAGCQTMLVLSGAETMADVEKAEAEGKKELLPNYVGDSLADLLPSS